MTQIKSKKTISDQNQLVSVGALQVETDPFDILKVPSKGLYGTKYGETLKVIYLKAFDSNILSSAKLINENKHLKTVVDKKLAYNDPKITYDDLLPADLISLIIFLRVTSGYGSEYPMELNDPQTGERFTHTVDLENFKVRDIEVTPDDNGYVNYVLPVSKKEVKLKYLTMGEEQKLLDKEAALRKQRGSDISVLSTLRLTEQIVSLDGVTDKGEIQKFIENKMSFKDFKELEKFIVDSEPNIDLEFDVVAPSGSKFRTSLQVGLLLY